MHLGLAAQVGWSGLRVGSRLALTCIRQINRVNSRNDSSHDDSNFRTILKTHLFSAYQHV